jgi:phosphate starvation-inducible membrane PsiE
MSDDPNRPQRPNQVSQWADQGFIKVESITYFLLGVLLTLAVVKGLAEAATQLIDSLNGHHDTGALVFAIDRLLVVLMIVEILHTVGVSFRSHTLTAEPFLVVGLIASIRRVLVVTLESSQVGDAGRASPNGQALLHAAMLELVVLGVLILIMVISIALLRRGKAYAAS